jgi:hypothetical protein
MIEAAVSIYKLSGIAGELRGRARTHGDNRPLVREGCEVVLPQPDGAPCARDELLPGDVAVALLVVLLVLGGHGLHF